MSDEDENRPERKNILLRLLINEMLEQVRDIQRHGGAWDPSERERAEVTLDRVMEQVRSEATRGSGE